MTKEQLDSVTGKLTLAYNEVCKLPVDRVERNLALHTISEALRELEGLPVAKMKGAL